MYNYNQPFFNNYQVHPNTSYQTTYPTNVLPPQQILQANGKTSVDAIRLSPNSSVLIADTTAPIVWKCVSDSLGNVTADPFDIIPHKDEQEKEREDMSAMLADMNQRLSDLEVKYEKYESNSRRNDRPNNTEFQATKTNDARNKKSPNHAQSDGAN